MIFPKELIGDFYPLEKSKLRKEFLEVPMKKCSTYSGNATENIIGNIHSQQVTVNSNFPEDVMKTLLANQEKITNLLETQNQLIESITRKSELS